MSIGQGHASRCALGVESTFGTAVAVTELIPFTSESVNKLIALIESEYLDGSPARKNLQNGPISIQGDLSGEMVYDEISGGIIGIERLIRGVMGNSARDAANSLNQYFFANEVDDHYTLAFNKQVSAWESQSIKFGSLEISGNIGEKVLFTVGNMIAHDLKRTGDAGIINAIAAITGISPSNIPSNLILSDNVFRIGDTANALASGDQYCIDGFTFSINNNLTEPTFATECTNNSDPDTTLEPVRNGFREVTLQIRLPRYESDQFFTWQNSGTALQADFKFTLGSYEFNILIPYLKVEAPSAVIGGPELIKPEINFISLRNAGRNTYMTFQDSDAITDETGIECKSARTSAA